MKIKYVYEIKSIKRLMQFEWMMDKVFDNSIRKIIETSFHFSLFLDAQAKFLELFLCAILFEQFWKDSLLFSFEERQLIYLLLTQFQQLYLLHAFMLHFLENAITLLGNEVLGQFFRVGHCIYLLHAVYLQPHCQPVFLVRI